MRVVAQQEAEWRERERRAGAKRLSKLMMISRIFMAFLILLKKSIKTSMKNYFLTYFLLPTEGLVPIMLTLIFWNSSR